MRLWSGSGKSKPQDPDDTAILSHRLSFPFKMGRIPYLSLIYFFLFQRLRNNGSYQADRA